MKRTYRAENRLIGYRRAEDEARNKK